MEYILKQSEVRTRRERLKKSNLWVFTREKDASYDHMHIKAGHTHMQENVYVCA